MQKLSGAKTIVAGCLIVGMMAGAGAVLVAQAVYRLQFLNTSLFTVNENEDAAFHVTIDDKPTGLPARVALRAFDAAGALVGSHDAVLLAGQSTTMRIPGPGVFRTHAQVVDSSPLDFALRRRVIAAVEVIDKLTAEIRPTCSFDPSGLPGGR